MAGIELAKRANNWSKRIFRDAQIVRVRRFDMAKITEKLPEIIDLKTLIVSNRKVHLLKILKKVLLLVVLNLYI